MAKKQYGKQAPVPQQQVQQEPINIIYTPNGTQIDVWHALQDKTTREILHAGKAYAGKTYNALAWIAMMAVLHPGSRWLIGRTQLTLIEQTTLVTLFELFNDWKVPETSYNYNKSDHSITLWNKSEILLKDLSFQPTDSLYSRLGGLSLNGAYLDEVNQIPVEAKNIVLTRIRHNMTDFGLTPKLLMTCNPSSGWVKKDFYLPFKNGKLPVRRKFIPCDMSDNPKSEDVKNYQETLEGVDDITRKRLLLGDWEFSDEEALIKYDAIQDMFSLPVSASTNGDMYLSIDASRQGKDSTVCFVWCGLHVLDVIEIDKSGENWKTHLQVEKIRAIINKYNIPIRNVIVDSDGNTAISDMLNGCTNFHAQAKVIGNKDAIQFKNTKAACYFKLADLINERKIKIFNCTTDLKKRLIEELEVLRADKVDTDSKLCIIPKDEVKRKLSGRSPDVSDAMMMRLFFTLLNKMITGEYFTMNTRM
jgi:phage terminase large subunit